MTRYRIVPDTLAATLQDGAVLLSLRTKRYYSLNDTGARVWELLGGALTPDEIVARLVEEFDVSEAAARRALDTLLAELAAEELIEPDGCGEEGSPSAPA